ncbi:MAG: hypothetical protein KJ066_02270 [Acidobacteria bacterium]|nr:hypothetical protein [Acidobacteriota bacterium]
MLRVVERVLGEGALVQNGKVVLRAGYELTLYREWTPRGTELVAGSFQVEGHLLASPDGLEPLLGVASVLTLRLDERRAVDLYVVNPDGLITSADDRGFYEVAG